MKLGDCIHINKHNLKKNNNLEEISYVDIKSVGEGIINEIKRIKINEAPSRAKRIVNVGDTIISTVRPRNRSFYYFKNIEENTIASTGFAVLHPIEEKIDGRYLFHYISNPSFTAYLGNNEKGAAYPAITTDVIEKYEIELPPLPTQKKIASILSAYDDLIENNLKRIHLLEEAAQRIYKEWFVDFKFPNHENTPINPETGLPDGWERIPVSEGAEYINGYAFKPKDHFKTGLPIIKIKELKNGISETTPKNTGQGIKEKYILKNGTIIFSWSAYLDVFWWSNGDALINQHLFKVVPLDKFEDEYYYFALKDCVPEFRNRANGATMKHIKRKELDNVKMLIPDKQTEKAFSKIAKNLLGQITNINVQNQNLKEARDLLLPRLMNRTIEV